MTRVWSSPSLVYNIPLKQWMRIIVKSAVLHAALTKIDLALLRAPSSRDWSLEFSHGRLAQPDATWVVVPPTQSSEAIEEGHTPYDEVWMVFL